ncbi:putative RNA-directed DNA polymerase [Tanacetum coccineum]
MATYLLNLLPSTAINNEIPFSKLFHKEPDYSRLRIFGCLCYPHLHSPHKLAPRATPCIFLGYPAYHRGYRCLDLETNKIILSRHVTFDETQFPYKSMTPSSPPSYTFLDTTPASPILHHILNAKTQQPHIQTQPNSNQQPNNPLPNTGPPMQAQQPQNHTGPSTNATELPITQPHEPIPLTSLLNHVRTPRNSLHGHSSKPDPNWSNAMHDEYNALHKFHPDSTLSRYKAQLVANGSSQQLGVDFDENFSPVVKLATIRTVLSLDVSRRWPIHQLDVKNEFLNGDLSEMVYMHQPPGFVDSRYPYHAMPLGLDFLLVVVILHCLSIHRVLRSCGGLQYLTFTRLDLSNAVQQICLYMHDPREPHFATLKRILRYVQGTLDLGLYLYASATTSLVGYTDADWADCPSTRWSTSGYCVFLGDNMLSWSAKRQHTISRSSAKAEYQGVANVVAETAWIRNLLRELHSPLLTATLVYCDNVSAVYMSANPVQHQRTKHIEIDIHFVRDMVKAFTMVDKTAHNSRKFAFNLSPINYGYWKTMIEPFLITNNLMGYVDGSIPCPSKTLSVTDGATVPKENPNYPIWISNDAHVRMLIISTISEASFRHVQGTTSRDLWLSLKKAHSDNYLEAMDNSEAYYGDDVILATQRPANLRQNPKQRVPYNLSANHATVLPTTITETTSFIVANNSLEWRQAMKKEYDALMKNGTWSLVPRASNTNVVDGKWVYRLKRDKNGAITRYKARFITKGFRQQPGIDFHETFSAVVKSTTIRAVLSLAVTNDWPLRHLDIQNTFLHGNLKEQAPRAWFEHLSKALFDLGFKGSKTDPSLFIYSRGDTRLYILVYVDDIIVTDLGPLNYFLGIEIVPHVFVILLSQKKYILELLQSAGLSNCNPVSSPMVTSSSLSLDDSTAFSNPLKYQQVVGSLQYITLSRPDITFAVNKVCQYMHAPTENHWYAVKRILRYLHGTVEHGMLIRRSSGSTLQAFTDVLWKGNPDTSLEAFSDADWAGDSDDRRSTGGFAIYLGSNLISWTARKQRTVSRSSTEAEYKALADTVAELTWLQALLNELGIRSSSTPILWCDNLGATYLSANPIFHARTKHVEIDYHFVREKVAQGDLRVQHISTHDQIADIFTKPLPTPRFLFLRSKLQVVARP